MSEGQFLIDGFDHDSIERVKRECEQAWRNRWQRRECFADRARNGNQRAIDNSEEWIAEVLETEAILG